MNVTRFQPWSIADSMADLMHRDLSGFATRRFAQSSAGQPVAEWVPAVDIIEEKDRFVLRADVPVPQLAAILHNDFKLDNTMINADGGLVAVFDWDMATLGDPLVDIGTLLAYWVQPDDPTYLVFGSNAVAIGEVMSKVEVRERYAERSGFDVSQISYYEGLALFRIAVIIEQIYARYLAGQTTDERFAAFEPLAPLLAAAACDLLS